MKLCLFRYGCKFLRLIIQVTPDMIRVRAQLKRASNGMVITEVLYGLVLSLLLSVNLGLSINESDAWRLTVCQLYRLDCPVYYLSKYSAVLHSLAMLKVSKMVEQGVLENLEFVI